MPPKRGDPLRVNTLLLSKHAKKSAVGANDNEYCSTAVLSSTPVDELQSLTATEGTSLTSASILTTHFRKQSNNGEPLVPTFSHLAIGQPRVNQSQ